MHNYLVLLGKRQDIVVEANLTKQSIHFMMEQEAERMEDRRDGRGDRPERLRIWRQDTPGHAPVAYFLQ